MLAKRDWAVLARLTRWLEPFKACFGHRAQQLSLREYVDGLLSDSARKSMQAMWARVTEPRSYQAFQHFITHAPWDATRVWRCLLAQVPERTGVLLLDDTAFLKQGRASVGVARQYASARHHVTNCQVAVTAAFWTGGRAWLVGAELYLPEAWLTPAKRQRARIPATRAFVEKWRLALTLVRRVRAAGLQIEAVVADAGYGTVLALRTALDRWGLPYVMGITSDTTVFLEPPRLRPHHAAGRSHRGPGVLTGAVGTVRARAEALPRRAWRWVTWRNGRQRAWRAQFAAVRVVPVGPWRRHREAHACWLLCERSREHPGALRFYLSNLPTTASVTRLARLAHQRWAIEQQYSDLKTELGIDHFEGRTYPGWQHHVVLAAVAHAFLQAERRRHATALTFPQVHAVVQEIFTGLLIASRPRYEAWFRAGQEYLRNHPLRI